MTTTIFIYFPDIPLEYSRRYEKKMNSKIRGKVFKIGGSYAMRIKKAFVDSGIVAEKDEILVEIIERHIGNLIKKPENNDSVCTESQNKGIKG